MQESFRNIEQLAEHIRKVETTVHEYQTLYNIFESLFKDEPKNLERTAKLTVKTRDDVAIEIKIDIEKSALPSNFSISVKAKSNEMNEREFYSQNLPSPSSAAIEVKKDKSEDKVLRDLAHKIRNNEIEFQLPS